jgi:parallel beta-helix repeat protein
LSNGDGPILSDMGFVYTLGVQPGTVIRNNYCHDAAHFEYGGWGIYLDEGSSHILVENNIVFRTTYGGFHQHYGRENIVRNNIFAFGRDAQMLRSRNEPHISYRFNRNIVYFSQGDDTLMGHMENGNFDFDKNVYWRTDGNNLIFDNKTLAEWQGAGHDRHSIVADPKFAAPEEGDFTIADGSPAREVGFKPIRMKAHRITR